MARSGWCPPDQRHTRDHAECQRRQDAGEISCDCTDHDGHTPPATTSQGAT